MNRVLASDRRQAFFGHIRACEVLPPHHLKRVITDEGYSARLRSAALRVLVAKSPIEITQGRPFAERRRLVRQHYKL